ncbi:MAG TPA: signal recognition particle-docking protein FtsY [Chloroflexota bacterium]|nr:signal recognition particle-docking protein FtsY [Chloroflexota bacterium]
MVFNLFKRSQPKETAATPAAPSELAQAQAVAAPGEPVEPDVPVLVRERGSEAGKNIAQSLERTRGGIFGAVRSMFQQRPELNEAFWDELEERLIQADLGAHTTADLVDELRSRHAKRRFGSADDAQMALRDSMIALLGKERPSLNLPEPMAVVLVIGVNGVGKTTSIAKLAHLLTGLGRKPLLVAGDTFRAAAIDQLKIWGERTRTPVVAQSPGSDPGAVVFDGLQAATSRGMDTVIIDTAGRLHTKTNLMEELRKVRRIIDRQVPGAPHETLLVLDAVTGQNGLMQAKTFAESVGVTGLILSKLDSSAKGGVVFSIAQELKLPIKFIGTGEQLQDFAPFDPQAFSGALFK